MLRRLLRWLGAVFSRDDPFPDDPAARAAEIRRIGRAPLDHGPDGTARVLDGLEDQSSQVRTAAAEVLGSAEVYHELVAADPLVDRLDDEDHDVRRAAAQSLTVTTDATVIDDVLPYALASELSVRAAGAMGLFHALTRVSYEFAPAQIDALLGAFTDAGAASDQIHRDDAAVTREYILAALTRGASPQDLAALDDRQIDFLRDALDDNSATVREHAATLLGHVDRDDFTAALRDLSANDSNEQVREAAADALDRRQE